MQFSFLLLAIYAIAAPALNLVEKEAAISILLNQQLTIRLLEHSITTAKSKLFGDNLKKANELYDAAAWELEDKIRAEEQSGEKTFESITANAEIVRYYYTRLEEQIKSLVNQQYDADRSSALKTMVQQRAQKPASNSRNRAAELKAPASVESQATAHVPLEANINSQVSLNQLPGAKLEALRSKAHVSDLNMPTGKRAFFNAVGTDDPEVFTDAPAVSDKIVDTDIDSKWGTVKTAAIESIAAGAVGFVAVRKHHLANKEADVASLALEESAPLF